MTNRKNKKLLELFCGTKCVGKVFENKGYDVVSLDYNPKFNATHTENILTWDYKQYLPDSFDVIWASPDCTTWSLATGGKYRTLQNIYGHNNEHQEKATIGNHMVLRVIEILNYFKCKSWFIENPKALMIHFPPLKEFIQEHNAYNTVVYYGNYNDWGCMKPTHIWSNMPLWKEQKPIMSEDKYIVKYKTHDKRPKRFYKSFSSSNAEERSKIPSDLINRLRLLVPNEL
jgi:site-specific DNA-cytosine methylase